MAYRDAVRRGRATSAVVQFVLLIDAIEQRDEERVSGNLAELRRLGFEVNCPRVFRWFQQQRSAAPDEPPIPNTAIPTGCVQNQTETEHLAAAIA